jgi:hypothetical protein
VGSVGANLGVLKDETVSSLRFCIDFLRHAIAKMMDQLALLKHSIEHGISASIGILQLYFMCSCRKQNPDGSNATTIGNIAVLISTVKKEIVETLRKVVEMLGRYTSPYLPMDARQSVKSFILSLPNRMVYIVLLRQG